MHTESAACREAIRLLGMGLSPVPITSPHSLASEAPGKAPIGSAWGSQRHTEDSLRAIYAANYDAGVGLLLGQAGGVIDVEMDGCEDAYDAFATVMGSEQVETMGWTSRRGPHALFRWDDRLAKYAKSKFGTFGIPGVEVRIGALPDSPKQVQSVCPPSLIAEKDEHGNVLILGHREWNGITEIAELPDAFFAFADGLLADEVARREASRSAAVRPGVAVTADDDAVRRYAQAAFEAEVGAVESAPPKHRNDQLNASAFALGQLVSARALDRSSVEAALQVAAQRVGQGQREAEKTIRSGLESGMDHPRDLSAVAGTLVGPGPKPIIGRTRIVEAAVAEVAAVAAEPTIDDIATAFDLIQAEAGVTWIWKGFIQQSVLNCLAAEPGCGKTRLCMDLARRLALGLPWPDGQPPTLPVGTRTLWVAADNQHAELATLPVEFGFDPRLLFLNTSKGELYGGTELQTKEQLAMLEWNIRTVQPGLVFIDTVTQTSDLSSHDTSDAKRQFKPLQEIAKRCNVAIIPVTHLANSGKPVGKRIIEKCRSVITLSCPDPDGQPNRRKLAVTKSNSEKPKPMGVSMGGRGNDYDFDPPREPETPAPPRPTIGGGIRVSEKSQGDKCADLIMDLVLEGPTSLSDIRKACKAAGFGESTIKLGRSKLSLTEYQLQGEVWLKFTHHESE